MVIKVSRKVYNEIRKFYRNVAKKYKNTYSYEDLERDYNHAIYSIPMIENGLLRRPPSLARWEGYFMATTKDNRWCFAYRISGNTIYVEDACHSQNIHESSILSEAAVQYGNL